MAYLSKQSIVKALQCIKKVEAKVSIPCLSALQYFLALDKYYHHHETKPGTHDVDQEELSIEIYLDGGSKAAKKEFISYVSEVIVFDDGNYLKSFKELYTGTKTIQGTIQSNFFGGSSVEISRSSTEKVVYPQQGDKPLIYALRGDVYRDVSYYDNIQYYLPTLEARFSLALWLLRRNGDLQNVSIEELREKLSFDYTQLLVETLLPLADLQFDELKESFGLETDDTCAIISKSDFLMTLNSEDFQEESLSHQQIYYGAPGTGKSHEINRLTEGEEVTRTTFHPDSDYSTFVGCYKPHMEMVDMTTVIGETLKTVKDEKGQPRQERRIVYKYSCQAFLQAYIAAWQDPNKKHFLVIEEINRGNCAQIFGDIFQLLDRNEEGYSSYPIKTDTDAEDELRIVFADKWELADEKAKEIDDLHRKHYPDGITKDIKNGRVLLLPSNLYIWATMNTSDQSLFPIDSAFKRRWDWKYIKIAEGRDAETKELLNWVVEFKYEDDGKPYVFECSWWEFIKAINEKIGLATSSDDKKLGYFFCKPRTKGSKEIDGGTFVGKVVFYLWNDVFKDEDNPIFKVTDAKGNPSFDDFYKEDEKGKTVVDTKALRVFMHNVFGESSDCYTEKALSTEESSIEE